MRRPKPLMLALAGLALSAATAVEAGLPTVCSTCAGQPDHAKRAPSVGGHARRATRHPARLCAGCAAKLQAQGPIPASAPCATCADPSGPVLMAGSTPGYAVIGDGAPSPVTLASSGSAPGYAIVGGTIASAEPAPIGVMRTNYQDVEHAPGTLGASVDITHGQARGVGMAPGMAGVPYAKAGEMPGSIYAPQTRRPRILSRVLGLPDFGRRRADAEARQRENHAMISYGAASAPSELPAAMVYGGR